ncbi:hypothetical protein Tco_0322738 [Tanacetum coccineum]
MDEDESVPIILGRPFLVTAHVVIDVHGRKLSLRVGNEIVTFNIGKSTRAAYSCDDFLYCADHTANLVQEKWVDTLIHDGKWTDIEVEIGFEKNMLSVPALHKKLQRIKDVYAVPRRPIYAVSGCANSEDSIKEVVTETITKLSLQKYMEEVHAGYGSNTTTPRLDDNAKFKLRGEFLKILLDNAFNEINRDDVVDHIAKFLATLKLIKIPNVDPNQLRLHVFPLSLTRDVRKWWIDEDLTDRKGDFGGSIYILEFYAL